MNTVSDRTTKILLPMALVAIGFLCLPSTARASTFTIENVPNVTLSGGSYSFTLDLGTVGFHPAVHSISSAAITMYFADSGLGTDDSVEVRFDGGILGGLILDPASLFLDTFEATLGVPSSTVQGDGVLSVTLFPGNVVFQRAVLEVEATSGPPPQPPPGKIALSLSSEVNPAPDVPLANAAHSFLHDLSALGFNPLTDIVTSASLSLYFLDNGLGTDDTVEIRFGGGILGGIAHDPPALSLDAFQATLNVDPALLQSTGTLPVSLSVANALFDRSVLEVHYLRDASVPEPGTSVLVIFGIASVFGALRRQRENHE
ncbi:MAG: PEP-CTERM sorting domain-containing protein [Bryobacter sp.]|nr:PEP-CTERM sorting domain-containing protein [Bryobacter sp.]